MQKSINIEIRSIAMEEDLKEILKIERDCFDQPWTKRDFTTALRQPTVHCWVAETYNPLKKLATEDRSKILAYLFFEKEASHIVLLNLAVAWKFRRMGIASQMLLKLISRMSRSGKRDLIQARVRDSMLPTHLFFASLGFRATQVIKSHFHDGDGIYEDAYLMEYVLDDLIKMEGRVS